MHADTTICDAPGRARTLGFLLREVYASLQQRVYEEVAASGHHDVRPTHSPVLRHLAPEGGRVADIARTSGLTKQSVAYIVDDLVRQGYLMVEPDPEDGRAKRLKYTPRGHELLEALMRASEDAEAHFMHALGTGRMTQLRESLEALHGLASGEQRGKSQASRRP